MPLPVQPLLAQPLLLVALPELLLLLAPDLVDLVERVGVAGLDLIALGLDLRPFGSQTLDRYLLEYALLLVCGMLLRFWPFRDPVRGGMVVSERVRLRFIGGMF